jgi:hypothetical protein
MAWRIAGTYVAACNCRGVCPCPSDEMPTSDDGECRGVLVFDIRDGNDDDTDLSGLGFALYNYWPENLSAGNWKLGLVVDEGASDEQAQALERILTGQAGGPFEDFAALTEEYLGMERAEVTVSNGDNPSGKVAGKSEFRFEPFRGPDGSPTIVRNAAFGLAPEFRIGHGPGHSEAFGMNIETVYGETADYEFSSEAAEGVRPRA